MPAQTVIKLRRGTASQWTSANPVLAAGEVGLETDTLRTKYGNGTSTWTALSYSVADASGTSSVDWSGVLNKPSTFPPSIHTHLLADITDYVEPDPLPSQAGNNGKYLTTNGSTTSWGTVVIPPGTTASDTAPSSPVTGQLWWKSDTGTLYIFYDNFWVEAITGATGPTGATGAAGATGPQGPSGVVAATAPITYDSGTQTVGVDGNALGLRLITAQNFSASTAVQVNNVFSSTYENYKVVFSYRASSATVIRLRMRTAGTDYTGNTYFTIGYSFTGTINEGDATQAILGWADVTGTGGAELNFYRPFTSTSDTAFTIAQTGPRSGSFVYGPFMAGAGVRANRSDTGFTIYPDGGNITGTVRVYGVLN